MKSLRPAHRIKLRNDNLNADIPRGQTLKFPSGFLFGAATASHQAEGDNDKSDWWRYERQPGKVRCFHDWPERAQTKKSDHWAQFDTDVKLMKDIGLNAYRFSIDWSRVEPEKDRFDEKVIDRYAEMCSTLRGAGIKPCVTLFHWSSPDWIWDHDREESTGFYAPEIVERFEKFCSRVVPKLAPYVDMFFTLNEPNIFLYGGFSEGILAPGHHRRDRHLFPVLRHLLQCHLAAYRTIKNARAEAQVGIAHQFYPLEPESNFRPLEWLVAAKIEQTFTWSFPDALATGEIEFMTRGRRVIREKIDGLAGSADYYGVNFYERGLVRVPGGWNVKRLTVLHDHLDSKEIWPREINDRAFVDMLAKVHSRYGLPIYVTENGRAHPNDADREAFLHAHLRGLAHAIEKKKIDVRGYFWWSFLDNQEWANGFLPRLGLYEVDYATGARTLRGTGRAYARIIRDGSIET